jgi:hypothetical protein
MEVVEFALSGNCRGKLVSGVVSYISSCPSCAGFILDNLQGININGKLYSWDMLALSRNKAMVGESCCSTTHILGMPAGINGEAWRIEGLSANSGMCDYIMANMDGFKVAGATIPWRIYYLAENAAMSDEAIMQIAGTKQVAKLLFRRARTAALDKIIREQPADVGALLNCSSDLIDWQIFYLSKRANPSYILANRPGINVGGKLLVWNIFGLSANFGMAKFIISSPIGFKIGAVITPWDIFGLSANSGLIKYIIENPDGFDNGAGFVREWQQFPEYMAD